MSRKLSAAEENSINSGKGLTALAMQNNVTVIVIVVLLALSGISAYFSLPKQQDPGFIIRSVVVTTVFPGANPIRVEQLVTDPVEEILQEIPEVDYIEKQIPYWCIDC